MRKSLAILLFGITIIITALLARAEDSPQACLHLDSNTGFARCATTEVVCYLSKAGQQCWPIPAPNAPTEKVEPKVKAKAKK